MSSNEERHVDCEVCGEGFTGDETIRAWTKTHDFEIDNIDICFDACRHHTADDLRAEAEDQVAAYKASVAASQAEPEPEPSQPATTLYAVTVKETTYSEYRIRAVNEAAARNLDGDIENIAAIDTDGPLEVTDVDEL